MRGCFFARFFGTRGNLMRRSRHIARLHLWGCGSPVGTSHGAALRSSDRSGSGECGSPVGTSRSEAPTEAAAENAGPRWGPREAKQRPSRQARTRFSARTARLGHSRSKQSTGLFLCAAPTSSPEKFFSKKVLSSFEESKIMERMTGLEPATSTLARWRSTR